VSWFGEILDEWEVRAIVLLVGVRGTPFLSILHTYIWQMWWKEGAILNVTSKKNWLASPRRKGNILSCTRAFLLSYPSPSFRGISLFFSSQLPFLASNRNAWDFGAYGAEDRIYGCKDTSTHQQVLSLSCGNV